MTQFNIKQAVVILIFITVILYVIKYYYYMMFMHHIVTKRSNLDIHLFLTEQDLIMILRLSEFIYDYFILHNYQSSI